MDPVLLSSKSDNWGTPQDFFDDLNSEFHFTLDVCASSSNAKCSKYFTKEDNGLLQDWTGAVVWCNPPYGRQIGKWIRKCFYHALHGGLAVMLIPARTDTNYFHDYILGKSEIRFVRGRLYFVDPTGKNLGRSPFPSMVVVFRPLDPNL